MRVGVLLNKAQTETIQESRDALYQLETLIIEGDTANVFKDFCECISTIIGCKKGDIPKSLLQFMSELMKKLKHMKNGRNFIHNLIKYLVRGVDAKLKHVRINTLSLLRSSIENLDSVSPRLWEIVKTKIGEKLFDKEVAVRIQAVYIAAKYQETAIEGGIHFYSLFKDLLRYDTSAEIRKLVLQYIIVNRNTISAIATRSGDSSESVRMVFVNSKLLLIPWDETLSLEQKAALLQALEEERDEEIRKKSMERLEIIFEEGFSGKFEIFTDSFYVENRSNSSLEKVLKHLMAKYEYADGFSEEFLERATPSLLFLMRVSLEYIDGQRGRDNIILPDMPILLRSIAESSCSVREGDQYGGTLAHALFALLEYYDSFQTDERNLLTKCGLYILGQEFPLLAGVVDSVCKMIIKACSGSESDKIYLKALRIGEERTQVIFAEALLRSSDFSRRIFSRVIEVIEEKVKKTVYSEDTDTKEYSIRALVLIGAEKNQYEEARGILMEVAKENSNSGICALVDLAILFRDQKDLFSMVFDLVRSSQFSLRDKSITKLLLSDLPSESEAEKLVEELVYRFYSEETNLEDAQYLHVFFYEYFRKKHWVVFTVYSRVISRIKHWKVFNDQIIYWFNNRTNLEYKESDLLLIVLSVALNASKTGNTPEHEGMHKKERKEALQRHLDLLSKVAILDHALTEEETKKALEISSALSKKTVKILPDSDVVKNIVFDLISKE